MPNDCANTNISLKEKITLCPEINIKGKTNIEKIRLGPARKEVVKKAFKDQESNANNISDVDNKIESWKKFIRQQEERWHISLNLK